MSKRKIFAMLLWGGFLAAVGTNCLPNISVGNLSTLLGGLTGGG
ncbi:MAG: hypothetical protein ACE5I3_01775 [Phycisphaerae bacterium]